MPRKKILSKKEPKRLVGLEAEEKTRPKQEKEVQVLQETSLEELSEVRFILLLKIFDFIYILSLLSNS